MTDQNTPAPADLVETLCAAISENGVGDFVSHETMRKSLVAHGLKIVQVSQSRAPADLVEAVKAAINDAIPTSTDDDMAIAAITAMQAYMASDGVTQMDRDAALALAKQVCSAHVDRIPDYDPFVQAFAAHRRAAAITPQPDPRDAEIGRLREVLEAAHRGVGYIRGALPLRTSAKTMTLVLNVQHKIRAALAKSEGQ